MFGVTGNNQSTALTTCFVNNSDIDTLIPAMIESISTENYVQAVKDMIDLAPALN
jgi:hypothetical protein